MAVIDGSTFRAEFTVGVRSATPRVRVLDQRLGKRRIYVTAEWKMGGQRYFGDIYYYGRFKYSGNTLKSGVINRINYLPETGGALKIKDINIDAKELASKSPWEVEKNMLRGNDKIIGSNFNNTLRGREGNDIIIGRGGVNRLTGGPGKDTFVLSKKGRQIITDFNIKEDRLQLPGPTDRYNNYDWYRESNRSFIERDGNVLAEFLGAPNLGKATYV